jgi:hypothetical protein
MSGQKKHLKAVERAKKVKVKLAKRRAAHEAKVKKERELELLEKRLAKEDRLLKMGKTPKRPATSEKYKSLVESLPRKVEEERDGSSNLHKNAQMLRDLEEQYDSELRYAEEYKKLQEANAPEEPEPPVAGRPTFKGEFQEAEQVNRGGPPIYPRPKTSFPTLEQSIQNLRKKFKDCQAQEQVGEKPEEKYPQGS